jgi:hypothetical protein
MFFSQEAIEEMAGSYGSMDERSEALILAFASFDFKNDRAREFASHGFSRRIRTLTHCIENVFNRLPPDDDAIPTTEACIDAAAYVQAFLFNVFGALDNLAWTWVQEKDIKNQDGGQLKETRVGLGKKYRDVRRTFSPQFRGYLDGHQDWFKHLADFRHALAHRIPLYIPRYAIVNHKEYADLQAQKGAVVGHPHEFDRLTQEQMKHIQFQPVMVHSFSEKSSRIVFHPQLLSDFAMVEDIGRKMLVELAREVPAQRVSRPSHLTRLWRCLRSAFEGQ